MDFKLTPEQLAWREEIRAFLREEVTPELREEMETIGAAMKGLGPMQKAFNSKMAVEKGWAAINWPKEYGGLEKTAIEQYIYIDEFSYARVRFLTSAVQLGSTIIKFGTEENKQKWLPVVKKGDFFSLGYSEPDAGTDLASLTTRAELVGDEWVINGVKVWNTGGTIANYMWSLVRTDQAAPKHKGMSLMFIPLNSPGITVRPAETWGEEAPCEVVLDNVRVPKDHLIGEVNKGWTYVSSTLGFERMIIGSSGDLRQIFDELVRLCKLMVIDGEVLAKKPAVRMRIAELAVDLEVAGLFGWRSASNLENGGLSPAHASMMKIFISELRAKLTDWGMQIVELYGQLNREDADAPLIGRLELDYRRAPYLRFGGGTSEVQRGIVAQGIGMPRR